VWTAVVGIGITAAMVYALERPERLSAMAVFQLTETVITFDTLLVAIFVKYAWRWPVFTRWLVRIPVLRTTWHGTITPIRPVDGHAITAPIAATLEIRQTLFDISCLVRTEETTSRSFTAAVFVDGKSGEQRLSYSYSADPTLRMREHNPRHDGTALMTIGTRPMPTLRGAYWTDRLTRGDLHFESTRSA
jgi:hypothetical protein